MKKYFYSINVKRFSPYGKVMSYAFDSKIAVSYDKRTCKYTITIMSLHNMTLNGHKLSKFDCLLAKLGDLIFPLLLEKTRNSDAFIIKNFGEVKWRVNSKVKLFERYVKLRKYIDALKYHVECEENLKYVISRNALYRILLVEQFLNGHLYSRIIGRKTLKFNYDPSCLNDDCRDYIVDIGRKGICGIDGGCGEVIYRFNKNGSLKSFDFNMNVETNRKSFLECINITILK